MITRHTTRPPYPTKDDEKLRVVSMFGFCHFWKRDGACGYQVNNPDSLQRSNFQVQSINEYLSLSQSNSQVEESRDVYLECFVLRHISIEASALFISTICTILWMLVVSQRGGMRRHID